MVAWINFQGSASFGRVDSHEARLPSYLFSPVKSRGTSVTHPIEAMCCYCTYHCYDGIILRGCRASDPTVPIFITPRTAKQVVTVSKRRSILTVTNGGCNCQCARRPGIGGQNFSPVKIIPAWKYIVQGDSSSEAGCM
jgi:hypothetical protein